MISTILNILLFIFILGILIFVHEFGHFITAKKSNVYIHEFSIGMGPAIKTWKGKDGIDYSLRAFPIGGYVQMAGEVEEDDKKVKKERFLCNRPKWQRMIDWVEKQHIWSEEDKMQLDAAINLVSYTGHIETANWLKDLKTKIMS